MDRIGQRFQPTPLHGPGEDVEPPRIEAYKHGGETVIFDGENPLAWIASRDAVPIVQQA